MGSLTGKGRVGHCKSPQGGCGEGAGNFPPITCFSLFSGQFLEELSKFSSPYKLRTKKQESRKEEEGRYQGIKIPEGRWAYL